MKYLLLILLIPGVCFSQTTNINVSATIVYKNTIYNQLNKNTNNNYSKHIPQVTVDGKYIIFSY